MEDQNKPRNAESRWERAKVLATYLDAAARLLDLVLHR